jgi:hypothetical protein
VPAPLSAPPAPSTIPARTLLALALLAFALRLVFVLLEPASKLAGDEHRTIGWALEPPGGVASPKVRFSPFRTHMIFDPPLYPYFIAAVHVATGSLTAVKIAQALLGTLLVVALARLGAQTFDARTGLAAGTVAALYPELIWFCAHFWSETLFMAFLWWSFERLVAGDRRGAMLPIAAAGMSWGAAVLTRETVLYFIPVVALWLAWERGHAGRRRAAVFLVTAVLTIAPWTYRNWVVFRAFVPVSTAGGQNLFQANARIPRDETYVMVDAVPGRIEQYRYAMRMGLSAIRERQPGWIFEKLYEQLPNFWEADTLALIHVKRGADDRPGGYGPMSVAAAWSVAIVMLLPYVLVLAAFVAGLRVVPWTRETALLAVFLIYYVALHIVAHGFARYRLPAMPVLFLVAACALVAPAGARVVARPRQVVSALVAIVLTLSLIPSLRKNLVHPALGGAGAADPDRGDEAPSGS